MKTVRLFFSLLMFAPALVACSSADQASSTSEAPIPSASAGEAHVENFGSCDSRRRQLQIAACASYNSGLGTCDYQCVYVNPMTCALAFGYPDGNTACSGRADCHNHVCDGAGSCSITTTVVDNGTYCDTNVCSTYGYSQCTAGTCGAPSCYWPGGECETRYGTFCSTQPVCTSTPSCW